MQELWVTGNILPVGARLTTGIETEIDQDADSPRAARRKAKRQQEQWVQLAEEYGLANPGMALVAVVKRKGAQKGKLPETRIIPVGMPQNTEFDSCFLASLGYGADLLAGVCYSIAPLARVCEESLPLPTFLRGRSKRKSLKNDMVSALLFLVGGRAVNQCAERHRADADASG